ATYRQYVFGYQAAAGTNSRLTSVLECAASLSDCLSPTTFTWQSATSGYASPIASSASVALPAFPLDVNGDGCDDLVWAQGGTWRYMFGTSAGYDAPVDTGTVATNPVRALPLEWNGDGRMDLLVDWADGDWRVLVGGATGLSGANQA